MTDKHPNQAVALAYWQDPTQEWREALLGTDEWSPWFNSSVPHFNRNYRYELRPHASKRPRRMRYVGGSITFPEPMREAPEKESHYWRASHEGPLQQQWWNKQVGLQHLATDICQATEQGAKEQSAALAELKMEYVDHE